MKNKPRPTTTRTLFLRWLYIIITFLSRQPVAAPALVSCYDMRFNFIVGSSIFVGITSSLAIDSYQEFYGRAATPTVPSNSSWSTISKNNSNLLAPRPTAACDGDRFGHNVDVISCDIALDIIPPTEHETLFGKRGMGRFEVSLPYRFMSRKLEAMYPSWATDQEAIFSVDGKQRMQPATLNLSFVEVLLKPL